MLLRCRADVPLELTGSSGNIVPGAFQPVLAKHSKHFSRQNAISIGVDEMQRNFDPMRKQVENWKESQLSDAVAKLTIYRAFIESVRLST